ncbi:MAG: hypothetical protein M3T96_08310 [Acidobacteriota bacterium]|nr:hypothetical protein [Acidobacteriota bacterium]
MLKNINRKNSGTKTFRRTGLIVALSFGLAAAAFGQTTEPTPAAMPMPTTTPMPTTMPTPVTMPMPTATPKAVMMPVLQDYKEVKIGMTAKDVRDKLGKAKIDDKDGFFYQISDDELAQIRLDKAKKVRLIAITYTSKNEDAPKFEDVFGTDVQAVPEADGRIYRRINYREAGYWVAYSRTAGDKPTVTVTMQKL